MSTDGATIANEFMDGFFETLSIVEVLEKVHQD